MSHRKDLMRNLATSLLTYGRIRTTFIKAKELQMVADRLVTLAKRGDLHAQRQQAISMVYDDFQVVSRLFSDIAPWYKERRQGGYTRIPGKLEPRPGDNSPMAFIEFVDTVRKLGEIKTVAEAQEEVQEVRGQQAGPQGQGWQKAPAAPAATQAAAAAPAKAMAPKAPAAKKPGAKKKDEK